MTDTQPTLDCSKHDRLSLPFHTVLQTWKNSSHCEDGGELGAGIFLSKRSEWYKNFSEKRAEIGTANNLPEIQRSTSERKLNLQEQKF